MSKYGKVSLAVLAALITAGGARQANSAEPSAGAGTPVPVELREVRVGGR